MIISNCYAMHDVSNFASSCRVADLCEMFHGQSVHIIWCIVHLFFGHYYLECVNCSAGIIYNKKY